MDPIKDLFYRHRRAAVVFCHAVIIVGALHVSFLLRFDLAVPYAERDLLRMALLIAVPLKSAVFTAARLHRGWWRFAGTRELARLAVGNIAASAAFTAVAWPLLTPRFPRSVYILDLLLCFLGTAAARFAVRLQNELFEKEISSRGGKGLLIYGAGIAGRMLLHEIRSNPSLGYRVLGFLDDDRRKRHLDLHGVPVLGGGRDASRMVDRLARQGTRVEEIIIAMPSADGRQMQEALANCRSSRVPCRTLPGIRELLAGKVLAAQIRDLSVDDLLGREQVQLDEAGIAGRIAGRSILITGAAGSIGSELCRQVARYGPRRLIALDQAESDMYRLEMEMAEWFPALPFSPEIGDICDAERVSEILRQHGVESILHAAAYKHVPLMEIHAVEAVKNNVLGTWNLVEAARHHGVSSFLMISSDKAVNPVSIMGATKRAAELIVHAAPERTAQVTNVLSVRFGNVLASNGSVVPLFQNQIAAGGPVTVTHPEVRRYFMSLPEAAQLVLQAAAMGKGAEIFVLDMGEPVRIVDLAANLIRLNGLVPSADIEIRFTGLRRGERLREELITAGEHIMPTYHPKIKIFRGPCPSREAVEEWVGELTQLLRRRDPVQVVAHLSKLVPEYQPSGMWARTAHANGNSVGLAAGCGAPIEAPLA